MRFIVLAVVCSLSAFAQSGRGTAVTISGAPAAETYQKIYTYSGSNLTYTCTAASDQGTASSITVSAASAANPVSFTATAHGFDYQSGATTGPVIKISGGTGDWAAVNGTWVATITGANTFTIAVDSSAFATFVGQTLSVTTRAPKTTDAVWSIQKFVYDASNNLIWSGWAAIAPGVASTTLPAPRAAFQFACGSKTTYGYQ